MNGSVAQLNRALDYGSRGSRFESLRNHSDSWKIKEIGFGSVAQLNRALDYGSRGSRFESLRNHFSKHRPYSLKSTRYGSVAQLNRALDYGSRGSRFESLRNHTRLNILRQEKIVAPLAQLVEQLTLNQWV